MIIGIEKILEMVKDSKLVEGLCDRELNNPEGAGFDLRLGEVYEIEGESYLGIEERHTPEAKLVAKYKGDKPEEVFEFIPNKYYLVKTIEKVNLPTDVSGVIFPRTTMFRSGLGFFNGIAQPGYCGGLTFGLCNFNSNKVKIALGARIAHITFHTVLGEGSKYRGQWQGGRVSTGGREVQI